MEHLPINEDGQGNTDTGKGRTIQMLSMGNQAQRYLYSDSEHMSAMSICFNMLEMKVLAAFEN